MSSIFQDDKGNSSSLRVIIALVAIVTIGGCIFLYFDWRMIMLSEISKPAPNYSGIDDLFKSMMIGFVGTFFVLFLAKIIQKYFER